MYAAWSRSGVSAVPSPLTVVISAPSTAEVEITQERTGCPRSRTVQAPHCARPQPKRQVVEFEFVTQRVEQRLVGIDIDRVFAAIHVERNFLSHCSSRSAAQIAFDHSKIAWIPANQRPKTGAIAYIRTLKSCLSSAGIRQVWYVTDQCSTFWSRNSCIKSAIS